MKKGKVLWKILEKFLTFISQSNLWADPATYNFDILRKLYEKYINLHCI